MQAVRLSIPIKNYEGTGVFFQHLYFKESPSKEEVLAILKRYHEQDSEYSTYLGTWQDCIQSVEKVEEWRILKGGLIATNTFIDVGEFGEQPFSWDKINIIINQ